MIDDRQGDRAVRAAQNQSLFREVNERIEELGESFGTHAREWLCECAHSDCFEQINEWAVASRRYLSVESLAFRRDSPPHRMQRRLAGVRSR
jgi:hypothetical protein